MKCRKSCVILGMMLFFGFCLMLPDKVFAEAKGIHVEYRTKEEIWEYIKELELDRDMEYEENPSIAAPYAPGSLSEDVQKNALDVFNACRYIAGIPSEVGIKADYVNQAQHAVLVNAAVNNGLSHRPAQPDGMDKKMYQLGYKGSGASNLAAAKYVIPIGEIIIQAWLEDSDDSNVEKLGHRRWALNPTMKYAGFGVAEDVKGWGYYAMYSHDNVGAKTDYYGVAWPAQNMPVDFFKDRTAWSISMGKNLEKSEVNVTLTRKGDGKVWKFSEKSANGLFEVNNEGYGQSGCIIFRPDNITYKAGDVFSVVITGKDLDVAYDVEFFSLCQHLQTEIVNQKDATCTEDGYTGDKVCVTCKEVLSEGETIAAKGHTEVEDPEVAPTGKLEGKTKGSHCSVCGEVIVKQEMIPKKSYGWLVVLLVLAVILLVVAVVGRMLSGSSGKKRQTEDDAESEPGSELESEPGSEPESEDKSDSKE